MTVRLKLILIVLLVALVPLVIATFTAFSLHRRAHDGRIRELYQKSAVLGATTARMRVEQATEGLSLLAGKTVRWTDLSPQERAGAVWLAYQQFEDIAIATLIDEEGAALATSFAEAARPQLMAGHPRLEEPELGRFAARIPFETARARGVALGEPLPGDADAAPVLPIAVRVAGPSPDRPWVVATGLSLRTLCRELSAGESGARQIFLVDGKGSALCSPAGGSAPDPQLVAAARREPLGVVQWRGQDGQDVIAASADLPWGWTVLVREPAAVAFAANRRIRMQSLLWIAVSLCAAILTGMLLSQGLDRSVRTLADGTRAVAGGNFSFRLPEGSDDEFGRFTRAFNEMSEQIGRRDEEIRAWNAELQRRVEERTRELEEAQAQLVEAHKLGAISALGAGMAHEINNPLTSVVGLVQVVASQLRRAGNAAAAALLDSADKEAQRIRTIVEQLTALSEGSKAGGFAPVDPGKVLEAAIAAVGADFSARSIEVAREFEAGGPPVLGRAPDLEQVVVAMLKNAATALKDRAGPRRVTVSCSMLSSQLLRLTVHDNGKGIPAENLDRVFEPFFTTKDEWTAKGMGLAMAYRTVREHNGTIKASSAPGKGTTFVVTLPIARAGSMLK